MYGDVYVNKNEMWYFDSGLQALCVFDLKSYSVRVVARYYKGGRLFSQKIFHVNGIIYITFYNCSGILTFDMKKGVFQEIVNEEKGLFIAESENIYGYQMLVDNKLWMIPRCVSHTVCYCDLHTKQLIQDNRLNKYIDKYVDSNKQTIVFASEYKSQLWSVLWNTHRYLRYDLHSGEITVFELENKDVRLNSVCFDGERVWLTQLNSTDLICVDDEEHIVRIEGDSQENQYSNIVNLQDDIIVLSRYGESIILIDKNTRIVRKINMPGKYFIGGKIENGSSLIVGCHEMENKIYLFPWRISDLLLLDKENLTIECVNIKNEEKFYAECMDDMLGNGMSIIENSHMNVDRYMNWVLSSEKQESKQALKKGDSIFLSINGKS